MKTYLISVFSIMITLGYSQEKIILPYNDETTKAYTHPEKEYFSNIWQTQVVTNVAMPSLEVFRPNPAINTGTAVIVAPGGGLYGLSINSEGRDVGKWLADKGITAFVLRYRLVPTGDDGVQEISELGQTNPAKIVTEVTKYIPLSIKDGLNAIEYVRNNAETYGIVKNKIGFMGFSAGGAVTVGVSQNYTKASRPDFLVPVYYWSTVLLPLPPKTDAPPMLLVCATDDPLQLASGSIALYNTYLHAGKSVALHMYAKGGHGFGMKTQNLPSDKWIDRFYDWAVSEKLVKITP
ncbi:alpha/beta hydrolase [Croceivirga sp. JEA036]|uniref:alpha/beta hydrolase n=1 Tax=Croceivirga sp. JEA036 TaxID=2721162 RepID=UPI00143C5EDB|nr:alpha/beta hydrolase [Croceivirga sp. JEA036]NJB37560.1 alpha/beta hydrolase [Croceivirga sp. JEA036]